ncbi:MAG: DUF2878 domain-containing protein [Xanthomonadales bacterium]|nr:DUF2878 domain-containing protein [Xanthomonadales bacterium]
MKLSLINYVGFQIGWLACVLSAANGRPLLGLLVAVLLVAMHLSMARRRWTEFKLLLSCAAIGTVFDSLLLATGWVSYPNGEWIPFLAPYWIIAMWFLFASTLNLSMAWLKGRMWLAAIMGALGGPLSYIAGQNLGAIGLENAPAALTCLAIGWAVIMPVLSVMAQRMDGFKRELTSTTVLTGWCSEWVNGRA